jgi:hypothetical protein
MGIDPAPTLGGMMSTSLFFPIVGALLIIALKVGTWWAISPYRKATPKELRGGAGIVAFLPLWGALFVYVGKSYLDKAGPVVLWFFMMGSAFVLWMWTLFCERLVPSKVSWCIGAFIWSFTLWLAFTDRLK